jgi:ubiquinone/menaquinone biosynthesis C-methylase UbiE
MKRKFDSDTAALVQRLRASESTVYDLEKWIIKQVKLRHDMKVLDLGCGTGKQMFALFRFLSSESKIVGIDISSDAVARVNQRAEKEGIANIKAIVCHLDDVTTYFKESRFDLILSTYAIYYSKDMLSLLSSLPHLLSDNGQVFACGYGKGTNQEFYDLVNKLVNDESRRIRSIDDFIEEQDIAQVAVSYSSYRVVRLANTVVFRSAESVLAWWKNHNSYIPELHRDVCHTIDQYIKKNGAFPMTKNVFGVLYES